MRHANTDYKSDLPLVGAIRRPNWRLAFRLLAPPISVDPNLCVPDGYHGLNALHVACWRADLTVIDLLLAAGADPTVTTAPTQQRVLQISQDAEVLNRLLQLELPLEQRDRKGRTPLLSACGCHIGGCVEALLAAGADIHATDDFGLSVLHYALRSIFYFEEYNTMEGCSENDLELIKLLVDHGNASGRPLNVEARANNGLTPLMFAAQYADAAVVKALLAVGVDPTAADGDGNTALHVVGDCRHSGRRVCVGEDEIIEAIEATLEQMEGVFNLLVEAGGDVHVPNANNYTPLELAVGWYISGIRVNGKAACAPLQR